MAVSTTNLIQGPGTLYTGATAAVHPAETAAAIVTPPATGWTDVGATTDGVSLSIAQEFSELAVDQIVDVPGRRLTKRDMSLTTNMAEATLANLAVAMNQLAASVDKTVNGVLKLEPTSDTSATQPNYTALILDGYAPDQKRRRITVRKALSTANADFAYQKDAQTVFSVTWSAHYVSPSIKPFTVLDEDPTNVVSGS